MALSIPKNAVIEDVDYSGAAGALGVQNLRKMQNPTIAKLVGNTPVVGGRQVPGKVFDQVEVEDASPGLSPFFNPDSKHVVQGAIGDCFALAALLSMLDRWWGSLYLNAMMKSVADPVTGASGTHAVLRMYDGANVVHYLRLKKQVLVKNLNIAEPSMRMWVEMILQGLGAFAPDYHGDNYGGMTCTPNAPDLGRLEGGNAAKVWKCMMPISPADLQERQVPGDAAGQGALFDDFLLKYSKGYVLAASTANAATLAGLTGNPGAAALGHVVYDGLVAGHSYSVVGVDKTKWFYDVVTQYKRTKAAGGGFSIKKTINRLPAVKLKNPWGSHSRNYSNANDFKGNEIGHGVKNADGTFWMPWDRFCEAFAWVFHGKADAVKLSHLF